MTEINITENLNYTELQGMDQSERATTVLEEGFKTGAEHVHMIAGVMLLTYGLQLLAWILATQMTDLFKSEEAASLFYERLARSFRTGRVVLTLAIFTQTSFTFVSTKVVPAAGGMIGP